MDDDADDADDDADDYYYYYYIQLWHDVNKLATTYYQAGFTSNVNSWTQKRQGLEIDKKTLYGRL